MQRPDIWNISKEEWEKYLRSNEGKADKKEWEHVEAERK